MLIDRNLEVECIDRMYLNVYQPRLQYPAGLVGYVHQRLGLPIASTAPLAKITDRFTAAVHRFAQDEGIPWVDFKKGQRKDDVMAAMLGTFTAEEGVVFIGRAREKTTVFRTEKRRYADGVAYPWIVRSTGVINHFYFYCVDSDLGPLFLKFCSYFPYNGKLHQRQPLGAAASRQGRDRLHPDGQRVRRRRRCGRVAAHLRRAGTGTDPGVAGQVAGDPAEPVHRRRPRRRLRL